MGSIAQTIETIVGSSQVTPYEQLVEPLKERIGSAIAPATQPACVAFPTTVEQLAEVVACAHQNQWRLLPCGHGSKLDWGALVSGADLVVSAQNLTDIIEHAAGDLTLTAQAGVRFADVQAELLHTNQFLAIDPAYPHMATLGGIVATRDTGALRQRFGGIRDMLIGVSFVRYDGQIAKAGGRVVKNVAGYDLMKLMTGSFGTLGILTQLTLRTYPLQERSQTVIFTGDAAAIQQLTGQVLKSPLTPVAMDLLTAGLLPSDAAGEWGLALQFQNIEVGVTEQIARLQAIAQPYALTCQVLSATDATEAQFWQALSAQLFPEDKATWAIAKVGVLPASAVDFLQFLQHNLTPDTWQARIHAASGIGILKLKAEQNSVEQLRTVRSRCQAASGYLNLLTAPAAWKQTFDPWGIDTQTQQLMKRLQAQFNPHQRLSPARLG